MCPADVFSLYRPRCCKPAFLVPIDEIEQHLIILGAKGFRGLNSAPHEWLPMLCAYSTPENVNQTRQAPTFAL